MEGHRLSKIRWYAEIIIYRTYAELKAEATRGYLGILWWIIEPLVYLAMFYFFFTVIREQTDKYLIEFLLVGLAVWRAFAATIPFGARSIVMGKGLMRQLYLPKFIFPFVAVLTNFIKFLIIFLLLLTFLLATGASPNIAWGTIPLLMLIQFILLLGICGVLAAVVPFLPDLNQIINNLLMILFFLSGVVIDLNKVPAKFKGILFLNPLAVLISDYRRVLIDGQMPEWNSLALVAAFALLLWGIASALMRHFDRIYPKAFM